MDKQQYDQLEQRLQATGRIAKPKAEAPQVITIKPALEAQLERTKQEFLARNPDLLK